MSSIPKNSNLISSETIVWEGPSIPCIDVCTGDKVSNIVFKVATLLCDKITDLSTLPNLDYKCILTNLSSVDTLKDPATFSLKLLFQLLLDNDCKLKTLVEGLKGTTTSSGVNLSGLNLGCITQEIVNLCGLVPVDLEVVKVLQAIINILCGVQDDVADLLIRVITLETRISALGNPGSGGYTEPDITSCLSTLDGSGNPIPVLMQTHLSTITDQTICNLKAVLGSAHDVNLVIQNQCLGDYSNNQEINQSATSLAEVMKNKEVIICDLLARISAIESHCCSFGCDDIKLGMIQSYDLDANKFTIDFTYGAGTNIPLAFVDCGSTFVLTDWRGVALIITPTTPLINGSVFDLPLVGSGLDIAKPITLQVKTCFTNTDTGLICKDCFTFILDRGIASIANRVNYWVFAVPDTSALACNGYQIKWSSIVTSLGNIGISTTDTTNSTGFINLPIFASPNNIIAPYVICTSTPGSIILAMSGQSEIVPPVINFSIAGTSFIISVTGTINTTGSC